MRKFAYAGAVLAIVVSGLPTSAGQYALSGGEQMTAAIADESDRITVLPKPAESPEPSAADQAATTTTPIEPPAPMPAIRPVPPPTLKASIDLSKQRMVVSENGKVLHSWAISSGREGYQTPTGTYRPQWLSRMHYSKKYDNAPMPHSVFFHHGYAIHATYATKALGQPASHGCIRLAPAHAKKFYELVQKHGKAGTRISLSGVAPAAVAKKRSPTRSAAAESYWVAPMVRRPPPPRGYYAQPPRRYVWPGDPVPVHPRQRTGYYRYGY